MLDTTATFLGAALLGTTLPGTALPAAALLLPGLLALLVTMAGYAAVWAALRREVRRPVGGREDDAELPPISVLKPLKGVDDGLYDNLAALARQDYPAFELVFGVADADDPATRVVARLADDFPDVPIRLVVGEAPFGLNPKVRNLASICRRVRHRLVLVSDSNVRPGPDYLRSLAATRRAGGPGGGPAALVSSLLTGPAVGDPGASRGAVFEDLHLGTFVAAGVAGAAAARQPCVVGKSMLFHLDDLELLGGWAGVRDHLAEDYVLGRRFHRAGLAVALSAHPLPVIAGRRRVRDFLARHLRWAQMRCRISRGAYLGELLLNPVALFTLGGAAAWAGGAPAVALLALAGVAAKVAADGWLLARLQSRPGRQRDGGTPRVPLARLAWVPVKDLLITGVWLAAPFIGTVAWRGTRLRIGRDSRLRPLGGAGGGGTETLTVEEAHA